MKEKSIKELKKNNQKTKKRTYYDRYNDAIKYGFNNSEDSTEIIQNTIILNFKNVAILSNNDMLRIHYKKSYQYRELWKQRVSELIKKGGYKKLKTPILVEALYIKRINKTLDYDASVSCLKYIIDGIVKSNLINDDTIKEIPYIITKTIVDKNAENDSIVLSIKEITSEYSPHSKEFQSIINKYKN